MLNASHKLIRKYIGILRGLGGSENFNIVEDGKSGAKGSF